MHMSVHPHLDAFWIFDYESYYNPQSHEGDVHRYFMQNRFHSVKEIFTAAYQVLIESKKIRENEGPSTQKAHRSFFNSEIGFFKRWFLEQNDKVKGEIR